jgi:hypothetical protein
MSLLANIAIAVNWKVQEMDFNVCFPSLRQAGAWGFLQKEDYPIGAMQMIL